MLFNKSKLTLLSVIIFHCMANSGPASGQQPDRGVRAAGVSLAAALQIERPNPFPTRPDEASPSDATSAIVQESQLLDPESVTPQQPSRDSLAPLQSRELTPQVRAVNISIAGIGTDLIPTPASQDDWAETAALPDGVARQASYKYVYWRPSLICHHPLYFQDVMLERHGHDRFGYLQPFVSGARFYGTIFLSPYLKTLYHPCDCQYALGYHRAGSCAPVLKSHIPWDKRAAAVQTLSTAGFFWAAPL